MEFRRTLTATLLILLFNASCRKDPGPKSVQADKVVTSPEKASTREIRASLKEKGFQLFDYVDETTGDTIIMQQYFMVFLKRGPNRPPISKQEGDSLQALHLAHLGRMYEQGFADISGPFGDDGEIRGITIYNTPSQVMADSLARLDPLVQLGRLQIEVHPWWAAKGFPLR
jgi:uncharacterized protein YciI